MQRTAQVVKTTHHFLLFSEGMQYPEMNLHETAIVSALLGMTIDNVCVIGAGTSRSGCQAALKMMNAINVHRERLEELQTPTLAGIGDWDLAE